MAAHAEASENTQNMARVLGFRVLKKGKKTNLEKRKKKKKGYMHGINFFKKGLGFKV
jgi:hypothetical protein